METTHTTIQKDSDPAKTDEKLYELNFNWSDFEDVDEDREMLLKEFKNDLKVNPLIDEKDLEEGMLKGETKLT